MLLRKNQAALTVGERTAYVNAVLALKNSVPSQMGLAGRYDDYVQMHMDSMMANPGWAHGRPAFLPWHREFLRRFELDLQAVDPTVTLPYWDWTVDQAANGPTTDIPWTSEFMGGDGDPAQDSQVTDGPFAFAAGQWTLNVVMAPDPNYLQRSLGDPNGPSGGTLPTPANVQGALTVVPYDQASWDRRPQPSFRNRLEGWYGAGSIHNRVHLWVGGTMTGMCSPNDPIFFLHHANVDRLWAQWQRSHADLTYAPPDASTASLAGQRLDDPMQPFGEGFTPSALLDHLALGYQYDDEPAAPAQPAHHVFLPAIREGAAAPSVGRERPAAMPGMAVPMFDLSPEDKAAGGHNPGMDADEARVVAAAAGARPASPRGRPAPALGLSPEDKAAGGHDPGPGR